jgi:hypothetical protein
VATGFTSVGLIWLGWKLSKNTKASDYSRLAVDEALNDGCIRAISGCFEQELKVKAPNDGGIQIISGYSEQEQKVEALNDNSILANAGYCIQTLEENI